jgi:Pvc16 N-terminal domain/Carboxypeptidase regulatory-like domain
MLDDLDATMKAMLTDAAAPAAVRNADISFDTPDKDFAPTQPTLSVFLHEVAENRGLRDEARIIERTGNTYTSRLPSLRLDCTYLITAWSVQAGGLKTQEEHNLLGLTLIWVSGFPVIDDRFVQGALKTPAQPYPLATTVAQTREGQPMGQFWSALGVPPRPAFSLTVTISVDPFPQTDQFSAFQQIQARTTSLQYPALSGRILDHTLAPVPGATVTVAQSGEQRTSGADGGFSFTDLPFGPYTLQVHVAGVPDQQLSVTYAAGSQIHDVILPAQ